MSYESKGLLGFSTALQTIGYQGSDTGTGQIRFNPVIQNDSNDGTEAKAEADKLNSDAALFEKSIENANDGAEYTAVGVDAVDALSSVTDQLESLAEIASQNNISYDYRTALNDEAQSLKTEYQRIKAAADYNTRDVLTSSTVTVTVKVGTDGANYIPITTGQSENQVSFSTSYSETVYNGTLNASTTLSAGLTRVSPALADLNGDGSVDLISGDNNNIYVQYNDGAGTFGAATSYSVPSSGGSTLAGVSVGDANGDGRQDIIVTHNGASGFVGTLLNNGSGFNAVVTTSETDTKGAIAADFNGDGYVDIAYRNGTVNDLAYRLGSGTGTFGAETILVNNNAQNIRIDDINGDGNLDLVSGYSTSQFKVNLGNGDGTFQAAVSTSTGFSVGGIAGGDYNRDGIADIAVSSSGGTNLSVFLGVGDGTFSSGTALTAPSGTRNISQADIDGDGNQDIVSANDSTGVVSTWISNGDGTFKNYRTINNGTAATTNGLAAGDINGDGADDLIASYTGVTGLRQMTAKSTTSSTSGNFSLMTVAAATAASSQFSTNSDYLETEGVRFAASTDRIDTSIALNASQASNLRNSASGRMNEFLASERADNAAAAIKQNRIAALAAQSDLDPLRVAHLLQELES